MKPEPQYRLVKALFLKLGLGLFFLTAVASGDNTPASLALSSISPTSGLTVGGQNLTLHGTGLLTTVRVTLGGKACPVVRTISDSEIHCTTPAHGAGRVDVEVTSTSGDATTLKEAYTYEDSDDPLKRAAQSKEEYLKVLKELKDNLPEIPQGADASKTAQLLYDWIGVLDELNRIGKGYGFESPYDTDLAEIGMQLTRNAASLVNVGEIGDEVWKFLCIYYRWSDDYTRLMVAQQQAQWLSLEKDKHRLLFWHGRLSGSIDYLKRLGAQQYVLDAFAEVDGVAVSRLLLFIDKLSNAEMDRILAKCDSESAIQAALDRLEETAVESEDPNRSIRIIDWTIILAKNLKRLKDQSPYALRSYPGLVLSDAVVKALRHGAAPSPDRVPQITEALVSHQYQELGSLISELFRDEPIADDLLEFVDEMNTQLLSAQKAHGILGPSKDYRRFTQRIKVLRMEKNLRFEGVYDVVVNGVGGGVLTLTLTRNGTLIASLAWSDDGSANRRFTTTLARTHIDLVSGKLYSHRYYSDSVDYLPPDERNTQFMAFRILRPQEGLSSTDAGEISGLRDYHRKRMGKALIPANERVVITGDFNNGHSRRPMHVVGELREHFPSFPVPKDIVEYGEPLAAQFSGGAWDLTINQAGDEFSGHISYRQRLAEIALPISFYDRKRRVLYLNSAEQPSASHIQVRGQFSADRRFFRGIYIIGGRGFFPINLVNTTRRPAES